MTCLILHHLLNRLQSTPYSLQHTAATLQRAATRCNALQHTRVICLVPHHPLYTQVTANSKFTATHCNSTATHCNTLQHHCNTVQCTATHACDMPHLALLSQHTGHGQLQIRFSTLQQHYNALQHTATHCNTHSGHGIPRSGVGTCSICARTSIRGRYRRWARRSWEWVQGLCHKRGCCLYFRHC